MRLMRDGARSENVHPTQNATTFAGAECTDGHLTDAERIREQRFRLENRPAQHTEDERSRSDGL